MNEYENAIEISGVTKRYEGFTLDNVSFAVPKGSIMGFIGQNGAGKLVPWREIRAMPLCVAMPDAWKEHWERRLAGVPMVR